MRFDLLSVEEQIALVKQEFAFLSHLIFEDPLWLKPQVKQGTLTRKQAKAIVKAVSKFNVFECGCCRKFDQAKFRAAQIVEALEPILDLAQSNVKEREYH